VNINRVVISLAAELKAVRPLLLLRRKKPRFMESLFRTAFWVIFIGMILFQLNFALRLRLAGEQKATDRKTIKREEWGFAVVRVIRSIALVVFLVLYAVDHPWLRSLSVPFPAWLRWMGVTLGVLSIVFYAWSRRTLGMEWSSFLQMRDKHRLVAAGPYACIRHPIYLSMMGFLGGIALITANWVLIAFLGVSIVDLVIRIPKEEQMMIEEFGDEYKAYMQKTGRLFPR